MLGSGTKKSTNKMQNKIIGAIAPKGSGKTHAVGQYIDTLSRVVTFDLVHEAGYVRDDSQIITGNLQHFGSLLLQQEFNLVYRPTKYLIEGDKIICPSFHEVVKLCYIAGDLTLVIDEAHLLCNAHSCPPMLMVSNLIGRHRRLSLLYVGQSFSAITSPLRRNTDEFWFWRIIEPSDLMGIRDRCGIEMAERVANLRKLEQGPPLIAGEQIRWDIWNGIQELQS